MLEEIDVADHARPDRRKERREMHLDRRKSDVDVMEHVVIGGVHALSLRATSHDRPRRSRSRKR